MLTESFCLISFVSLFKLFLVFIYDDNNVRSFVNFLFWVKILTLISEGSLEVQFEVGGGTKITPCLKLVWIMLERWNFVHKYTHICSFRNSTKAFLLLLMSAFFLQKTNVFGNNSTFTQSNNLRYVLDIF